MTRRRTIEVSLEVFLGASPRMPGTPIVHVEGYGPRDLWLWRSDDDGLWHSLFALPGVGCRLPASWTAAPELPALAPILERHA